MLGTSDFIVNLFIFLRMSLMNWVDAATLFRGYFVHIINLIRYQIIISDKENTFSYLKF